MNNPNYYAIIPANVRYNKELTFLERFLYAELTALSNCDGYTFASNKYFAELYEKDQKTISRAISHLEELNYIRIEYDKVGAKVTKRRIYLSAIKSTGDKIVNRTEITGDKNVTREQEKYLLASDKIVTDNNVSYEYILSLIMYNLPKSEKEIIKSFNFSKELEDKIYLWLQYKREKKQGYKQIGLQHLLEELKKDVNVNNEQYVINAIDSSIKHNYSGIFAENKNNYQKPKNFIQEKNEEYIKKNGDWLKRVDERLF